MGAPLPGTITFYQWCEPPLKSGEYTVDVRQTVPALRPEPFTGGLDFLVEGPRFALNPADIYCVYPPGDATGDFANSLPHIVFARRTIPWERDPAINPAAAGEPWMALLTLNAEGDKDGVSIPKIVPRTVNDLVNPSPADGVTGPKNLKIGDYEKKDPCNTIDLDGALFQQVAPRAADLAYLAHVREVNTDHKETLSFLTDGTFSVLIGNRFPKPQAAGDDRGEPVENRAILVSLEGMWDFLPGSQSPPKKVRLAVLASWTFHCEQASGFKASMEDLGDTLLPLRLALPEDGPSQAVKYARAAFSRGYAALNHNTRLGEKTVSWYRGPLTPVKIDPVASSEYAPVPDSQVRYDYRNGLMDLTYAAAAQLGRLLGLQDRTFAQALCAWRVEVQGQIKELLRREELRQQLNGGVVDPETPESLFLESALADAMTKDSVPAPKRGNFEDSLKELAKDPNRNPPAPVCEWLARRVLLYGVPFSYLVPDERMLPSPSMRFFRLDPEWIKCLLEGACSVGRSSAEEQMADRYLRDKFFNIAVTGAAAVRQRQPGEAAADPAMLTSPLVGFLLRSPVVRGWQGLEMEATYKDGQKTTPVRALRIDRLSPDIMLCIFKGPLSEIVIRQPPEGMHFGATVVVAGSKYTRGLRKVTADKPGDQIQVPKIPVPLRGNPSLRVVDVAELAKSLYQELVKAGGMDKNAPFTSFTSAEFGVQMVESPGCVVITVGDTP
jgi:hypothetical protein